MMSASVYCWLGGACVLIVVFQILKNVVPWLYKNLIGPKLFGPRVDVRQMGQWAVVTGATDGIGKSYAKALAKKGLNLVLISRSIDKLMKVADEIRNISSVQIITIDVDFTQGIEIYDKIKNEIGSLEIGTLVNNVGMCYEYPEYFLAVPDNHKLFWDLITCNITSVTYMSKLILPAMVERKKGVIINVASLAALLPNPLLCVYAASKAYVDKFSCDLSAEYKSQGIIVQCILPGPVITKMVTSIDKESWVAPNSDAYVSSALKTLGVTSRTNGYFAHTLMKLSMDILKAITCTSVTNSITVKAMKYAKKESLKNKAKLNL